MSKTDFDTRWQTAREAGLVSIMVTLILMIVISLIVLGFAQISRRNQRNVLDRQLSTQAFYAAETGVNDARNLIATAVQAGSAIAAKSTCADGTGMYAGLRPDLDTSGSDEAEYTCVMVNPTPDTLLYGDVGKRSTIIPVISATGTNISRIVLTWQTKDDTTTPTAGCPPGAVNVFPPTNWTCGYGVMRLDVVPTNGTFNYADLQNRAMTTFLVPLIAGGSTGAPYVAGGGNNLIGLDCSDSDCNFTVNITTSPTNQYYMRVSSLYKDVSSLRVNAYDAGGALLALSNAQVVIDSTGKAQDVLRRIQVHVPLTNSSQNQMSDYAMQSTDALCKRFAVMDNYFKPKVVGVSGTTNPLCQFSP